ncbi:MAG: hypothetical protein Q4D96_13865 [Propionibacteriaceae bacterium]|nr:hypothetical protein [Propionibacteriaceae bacterium]
MRWAGLWREIARNITSGTTGVLLFGVLAVTLLGGIALSDLTMIRNLSQEAEQYRSSGAAVLILRSPGGVDGAACDALGRLPGVSAGALREAPERLVPAALPAAGLATHETTPGLPDLLGAAGRDVGGVWLPESTAESLGVGAGGPLVFTTGTATVAGTYPWDEKDGRRPGYGYAVLVPGPAAGAFDECWATAWPAMPGLEALMRLSLSEGHDEEEPAAVERLQLNSTLGTRFDGPERFTARPTSLAPIWLGAAAVGLGFVAVRRRKLELASELHAGISRVDVAVKVLVETAAWGLPAALLIVTATSLVAGSAPVLDRAALLTHGALFGVIALLGTMLGASLALLVTREAHLNRYFKTRL